MEQVEVIKTIATKDIKKASPKLIMALEYLLERPGNTDSARAIAAKLGISHTWVNQAKTAIADGTYKDMMK